MCVCVCVCVCVCPRVPSSGTQWLPNTKETAGPAEGQQKQDGYQGQSKSTPAVRVSTSWALMSSCVMTRNTNCKHARVCVCVCGGRPSARDLGPHQRFLMLSTPTARPVPPALPGLSLIPFAVHARFLCTVTVAHKKTPVPLSRGCAVALCDEVEPNCTPEPLPPQECQNNAKAAAALTQTLVEQPSLPFIIIIVLYLR